MELFCNKAIEEWSQVPDVNETGITSPDLGGKKKQYQFFSKLTLFVRRIFKSKHQDKTLFSPSPQVPCFLTVVASDSLPPSYWKWDFFLAVCATTACSNTGQFRLAHCQWLELPLQRLIHTASLGKPQKQISFKVYVLNSHQTGERRYKISLPLMLKVICRHSLGKGLPKGKEQHF